MKISASLIQFFGFGITSLVGTLLHFLFDWTGKSLLTASFSAVNESTFEHMKILFVPLFLFAAAESLFFANHRNFWCVKLKGITLGLLLIPIIFYTVNGAFVSTPDWFNIAIYFISAAVAFFTETRMLAKENGKCLSPRLAFLTLCLIAALFVFFTFFPPRIPLFRDPVTGTYGIS
ncbi:MAG: hypothetical protein E7638_02170 [Ruminococcaceae bacterium]|nr:hypothetical protein [Oscillospiraceae bacterium]